MRASVTVRVPASTSNLGAGFDCVGLAVDRWLTLTARWDKRIGAAHGSAGSEEPVRIERAGTLGVLSLEPERDFLFRGFAAACRRAGRAIPAGLWFEADSDIPIARGLGSSAAATLAGVVAAATLLELGFDRAALAQVATELEGHADNVAAAAYGGATLVLAERAGLIVAPLVVHESLAFVFAVPDFTVETRHARAVLPASLPHADAAHAAAKSAALVRGLESADPRLLAAGLDDVLHVPFRRSLVPGYDEVTGAATRAGAYGATLSGSGPTLVAVAPVTQGAPVAHAMVAAWRGLGIVAEAFQVERPAGGYVIG
jgi:homoserine kinase